VILVGHSYAGMIISGVVEANADCVQRLVFLDAFIPEDGQSVLDLLPPEIGAHFRNVAREHGNGWRLPGGEGHLDLWGLKPGEAREFVRARLCDFSLRCFEEPLRLPANRKAGVPATFVAGVAEGYPARPFFEPFARKARAFGWEVAELNTGHDCHVERPGEVADILLSAALQ
jgi:pimeloyl-ACP methyl ester carboxylesterase